MSPVFCICHRGALGDFILTWPALLCLRNTLHGHRFLGIGRPDYMSLAVRLGILDSFHDTESARLLDLFSGRAVPPEIGSPDGAVLWLKEGESAAALLRRSASLPVVTIPPIPPTRMHAALYHCLAVREHFPITIPRDLFSCFPHRKTEGIYALVHPGSGSRTKNFSTALYLAVADELRQAGHRDVRFVLGPAEDAQSFSGVRIERPQNAAELAELLKGAALFVGNDSGVSHLSGALGVPTIALYKATDPEVWGVLGRKVANLPAPSEESALLQIQRCLQQWNKKAGTTCEVVESQ